MPTYSPLIQQESFFSFSMIFEGGEKRGISAREICCSIPSFEYEFDGLFTFHSWWSFYVFEAFDWLDDESDTSSSFLSSSFNVFFRTLNHLFLVFFQMNLSDDTKGIEMYVCVTWNIFVIVDRNDLILSLRKRQINIKRDILIREENWLSVCVYELYRE